MLNLFKNLFTKAYQNAPPGKAGFFTHPLINAAADGDRDKVQDLLKQCGDLEIIQKAMKAADERGWHAVRADLEEKLQKNPSAMLYRSRGGEKNDESEVARAQELLRNRPDFVKVTIQRNGENLTSYFALSTKGKRFIVEYANALADQQLAAIDKAMPKEPTAMSYTPRPGDNDITEVERTKQLLQERPGFVEVTIQREGENLASYFTLSTRGKRFVVEYAKALAEEKLRQQAQKETQRAREAITKNQWQAALWWSSKALEARPGCAISREIFDQAVANTMVGYVLLLPKKERQERVTQLLRSRNMTSKEAEDVATLMIDLEYSNLSHFLNKELIERATNGNLARAKELQSSDLKTACQLAAHFGDLLLPGQTEPVRWKSMLGEEIDSIVNAGIARVLKTLVSILRSNSRSDWIRVCNELALIWNDEPESREMFSRLARTCSSDEEFITLRNKLENTYPREAAKLSDLKFSMREPV